MSVRVIQIPGGGTGFTDCPEVAFVCSTNEDAALVVRYVAGPVARKRQPMGVLTFRPVWMFRWISSSIEHFPEDDPDDTQFGLVEILRSPLVERAAQGTVWADQISERFGPGIPENRVRHFRLSFDEIGHFDVLADEVIVAAE